MFVAEFIGSPSMNFLECKVVQENSGLYLKKDPLHFKLPPEGEKSMTPYQNKDVILGIRPEHFELTEEGAGTMHIKVDHVETLGADTLVHGHIGGNEAFLTIRLPDIHHFTKGTILPLAAPAEKLHLFDKDSGTRLED